MNILAGSGTVLLGQSIGLCAYMGCLLFVSFGFGFFSDCQKKGFSPEAVECACGCLALFFICASFFPIVDIWNYKEAKDEKENPSLVTGSLNVEDNRSIQQIIVGITLAIFMAVLGCCRSQYAQSRGTPYPAFNIILAPLVGIVVFLIYLSWFSGAYK